jgi:hypothetical protein
VGIVFAESNNKEHAWKVNTAGQSRRDYIAGEQMEDKKYVLEIEKGEPFFSVRLVVRCLGTATTPRGRIMELFSERISSEA